MPRDDVPVEAERVLAVRIGTEPWIHRLGQRTFTISDLDGHVRSLELECTQDDVRLEFDEDMEWTVPASWGDCQLRVSAKRGATFALYEFSAPTQA